jgi:hypothetical protein
MSSTDSNSVFFSDFASFAEAGDGTYGVPLVVEGGNLSLADHATLNLDGPFSNSAAVSLGQDSTMNVNGGGQNNDIAGDVGSFSLATGSFLNFSGGYYTLPDGSQILGAGTADVTSGTLQAGSGGFIGATTIQNFEVDPGGTVVVDELNTLVGFDNFLWTGGTVTGGSFGVTFDAYNLTINTATGVTLQGACIMQIPFTGTWVAGPITLSQFSVIHLQGIFTDQANSTMNAGDLTPVDFFMDFSSAFTERGDGTYGVPFVESSGAVVSVVQGSTLNLNDGGSSAGNFSVDATSVLNFGANYTLSNGAILNGAQNGQVVVVNGVTLTFDSGTGGLVAIAGITLNVEGGAFVAWVSGDIEAANGAAIINQGTFNAESDNTLFSDCTTAFTNLGGTLEKTGGSGTTTIDGNFFSIDGTVVAFTGTISIPGC